MQPFHPRPNTCDQNVYNDVVHGNEYRLPAQIPADVAVLDIGGHVGSFTRACLERGARMVYVYEPDAGNFELLCQHLDLHYLDDDYAESKLDAAGEVQALRMAMWRADVSLNFMNDKCYLPHTGPLYDDAAGELNTGGGNTLSGGAEIVVDRSVPTPPGYVRADTFPVEAPTWGVGEQRFWIKIDCEGSEWPILYSIDDPRLTLAHVDRIMGEFHEFPESLGGPPDIGPRPLAQGDLAWTRDGLVEFLERAGFTSIEIIPHSERADERLGLFFASR